MENNPIEIKTSGILGSNMTMMLRGSCMRIRITRPRLRLRISFLGFALRPRNAQSNSASNSKNFTIRFSFNADERNKLLTKLK